ncbi:MAG: hypothetical protein HFI31_03785 [Lachnospiraceae bacterium]|nr:hypothetical protein [Lachnospiraceae bacterium]MCI9133302.1 hypothetical protein [Lachnospiraceae bacterium]
MTVTEIQVGRYRRMDEYMDSLEADLTVGLYIFGSSRGRTPGENKFRKGKGK